MSRSNTRPKHARRRFSPFAVLSLVALAASATGCLSSQNSSTLDAMSDAAGGKSLPFVEAYIEYAGPQSRWAGPTSFTLRVIAKDAGLAQISVAPSLFAEPSSTLTRRMPASAGTAPTTPGMSGEGAREQIANLMIAMQGQEGMYRGCLAPVRVRLIRADGALVEKQGCRGQSGWTRVASQTVDRFLTAAIYGVERVPASAASRAVTESPKTPGDRKPVDKH